MRDAVNKAARIVINHCLEHGIGKIVFGWNQRQKNGIELGKKKNSEFIPIPTGKLKNRIAQLTEQYGIRFIETEETNSLPKHGEKPKEWKSSGKRVKRGLFRKANNWFVNCDAQAAANVLRKVSMTLGLDLSGVCRGALTRTQRSQHNVKIRMVKSPD